jgi:hypothetical protein
MGGTPASVNDLNNISLCININGLGSRLTANISLLQNEIAVLTVLKRGFKIFFPRGKVNLKKNNNNNDNKIK